MKRFQFPMMNAFSITINKSQGQSFERDGLDLSNECFVHCQLYVALSRTKYPNKLFNRTSRLSVYGENITMNVVYKMY